MAKDNGRPGWGKKLVNKLICPNCWHSFPPEEAVFIARHTDLLGDEIAGPGAYLRFEAVRFNVKGEAIDPKGFATTELACPQCHLQVPEAMLEVPPLFISMIGSPASGKSYFLTTMCWELRTMLPRACISFGDAMATANAAVHEYERTLFLNPKPDQPTAISKTDPTDTKLYREVTIRGVHVRFPKPLQFSLWPTPEHPRFAQAGRFGRIVVMYDNAGEDFQPGADDAGSAVVQHLSRSQIYFFLFDPTQDPRLRAVCRSEDPQMTHGLRPGRDAPAVLARQETYIREASVRIRRYQGLAAEQRLRKPLIVILPKFDIWQETAGVSIDAEPYIGGNGDGPLRVDTAGVERVSDKLRTMLQRLCPEFVAAAETLSEVVRYIPVSSLGGSPELIQRGQDEPFYGIRPKNVHPKWVTVPLLYSLCKWAKGIVQDAAGPDPKPKGVKP